ncbi:sporulation integral membrane protein YlbJ [Tuberibacillus sp. Marseille-P3662]|uniref:sporulation integral membrane protein YlbJ n=1 Tax=Tuberibacillus sp. Marseille-P3662 TaxID=1965358 RepID=UPI000A1CB179|nr:sporulation integral membrane protein YlbJ [Tuberibacillus sp. Marseille-P3662]
MTTVAKIQTFTLAAIAIILAAAIVAFPKTSVDASVSGLKVWWNVVFPSLLPFFILSELLIGFGVVTFIGVLLEPIMRPIFKVPGIGGFVFVMGLASGFPAGAKFTARLYEQNQLTKTEAERLASFTNFSNPLFMSGAIAYGFFGKASLGIILMLSHYIGNICVGLLMRFYKSWERSSEETRLSPMILGKALRRMHRERMKNKQPIGQLLGDAVQSSVQTLLMVGGFIILFSVLNQLLEQLNITAVLATIVKYVFALLHITPELSSGFIPGLFEITVGARKISEIQAPLMEAVIVTSFILGFCGLSIQAQVASILAQARLDSKPFFIGRIFHGLFAAIVSGFLFMFMYREDQTSFNGADTIPVLTSPHGQLDFLSTLNVFWHDSLHWGSWVTLLSLILFVLVTASRLSSQQKPRY